MFWDGVAIVVAVILAVNGWRRGLLNSWRGPLAIIAATLIVQQFYIDFSTWIMTRLRVSPEAAVLTGYLMLWFTAETVIEIGLAMTLRLGKREQPLFFDRVGGVLYGLAKAAVIVILPLMAISVELKIPPPPPDRTGLKIPVLMEQDAPVLVPGLKSLAAALVPVFGRFVVSEKEPSFKPVYDLPAAGKGEADKPGHEGVPRDEIENLLK